MTATIHDSAASLTGANLHLTGSTGGAGRRAGPMSGAVIAVLLYEILFRPSRTPVRPAARRRPHAAPLAQSKCSGQRRRAQYPVLGGRRLRAGRRPQVIFGTDAGLQIVPGGEEGDAERGGGGGFVPAFAGESRD